MLLELSAVSVLFLLAVKEVAGLSSERHRRLANFLYVPVLPLLVLFVAEAAARIAQLPSLR